MKTIMGAALAAISLSACVMSPYQAQTTVAGAVLGGTAGALITRDAGGAVSGALLGGAVGSAVGYGSGYDRGGQYQGYRQPGYRPYYGDRYDRSYDGRYGAYRSYRR